MRLKKHKNIKRHEQFDIFIFSGQPVAFPFPQNHDANKIQIIEV